MEDFSELRYPFTSILEFISGGYAFGLQGLHLAVSFLLLGFSTVVLFKKNDWSIPRTLSLLYFSLQPFNNPAFTIFNLDIADICGIVIGLICVFNFFVHGMRVNSFIFSLLIFTAIASIHASAVWYLDNHFSEQASLIGRYVVIAKVGVMILVFCWVYNTQEPRKYFHALVESVSIFSVICCIVYAIQLAVFLSGTTPYGSFAGAGFSTSVAFGGVSIERGHLSKFMAPLFMFISLDAYLKRRWWVLYLYIATMLMNFSASGLSFLAFQCLMLIVVFWDDVSRWILRPVGLLAIAATVGFITFFADAYGAIIDKIYHLVFLGDDQAISGRSLGLLFEYLEKYPFGMGYSGSTYRTAPNLPEMNMGLYAFIAQMSLLSIYYILALLGLISYLYFRFRNASTIARLLLVSALSMPFVFVADTLWFLPLWWISVFWLTSFEELFERSTETTWANEEIGSKLSFRGTP